MCVCMAVIEREESEVCAVDGDLLSEFDKGS